MGKAMNPHGVEPPHLLVTKREAARLLSLSERAVDLLSARGDLPKVRLGSTRGVRFRLVDLERLIESRMDWGGDGPTRDRGGRFSTAGG
jgi:predicted DNA-binding transcriptional regulator AlpA